LKALTLIFVILIALLQYPLWLGKGSWLRVWNVNQQISEQKEKNVTFKQRNETLNAEVRDLKQGNAAIEERARSELGMIKQDEVFYQVIDQALPMQPANPIPVMPLNDNAAENDSAAQLKAKKTNQ
jgi:cell division protein FtsB